MHVSKKNSLRLQVASIMLWVGLAIAAAGMGVSAGAGVRVGIRVVKSLPGVAEDAQQKVEEMLMERDRERAAIDATLDQFPWAHHARIRGKVHLGNDSIYYCHATKDGRISEGFYLVSQDGMLQPWPGPEPELSGLYWRLQVR